MGGTATSSLVNRWCVRGMGMDDPVGVGHTGDDARREGQGLGHHSTVLGVAGAAAGGIWRERPGAMGAGRKQRKGASPLDPHPRSTSGRDHCGDRRHGGPRWGSKKDRLCALWAIVPGSCNTARWGEERSRQRHPLRSLRQRGATQGRKGPPAPWPRAWHTRRGGGASGRPLSIPRRAADWTVDVTVKALFDGGGGARCETTQAW